MTTFSALIVDDEPGMRLGAERILKDFRILLPDFGEEISFSTRTAATGGEALALLEAERPDLLLLDYKLPDVHGLEILSSSLRAKNNVLTVMITAYASLEVAINATKNGAFDFLAKPFTPEELTNTVRKAAEHLFLERKAQKLEAEKRQVRFQFVSVLAHELKSPLAAIENYLRIMAGRVSGDALAAYDSMIDRSLLRIDGMRKLIVDLLDLTHIESGQKARSPTLMSLRSLAEEALEKVRGEAESRNVALTLDCDAALTFFCDRGELEILISNLLTNAVKYNRDGGTVALALTAEGDGLRCECRDTGIGMTSEETAGLFKEFYRVKNAKTKNVPGSGLGLSIVKKIVDLYGGSIAVESVAGEGTTVRAVLKTAHGSTGLS
ncbi:MAG: hybrid sensor histidine kinase/response regulator [Spirochaetales bacterium]|nr:hybrid sensor histidine kinase/response regulator [Spirochaetales bacterium]